MTRLIYVDFSPGWIAAWDATLQTLAQRQYELEEIQRAEMAAIELGLEVLGCDKGIILTDSLSAVRMIYGGSPHPRAKQAADLLDTAAQIAARLDGTVITWIPRASNLADKALRQALKSHPPPR